MSLSLSHDAAHHRSAPAGVVVAVTVTVDLIATKSYVVMNREVLCWLCVCAMFSFLPFMTSEFTRTVGLGVQLSTVACMRSEQCYLLATTPATLTIFTYLYESLCNDNSQYHCQAVCFTIFVHQHQHPKFLLLPQIHVRRPKKQTTSGTCHRITPPKRIPELCLSPSP